MSFSSTSLGTDVANVHMHAVARNGRDIFKIEEVGVTLLRLQDDGVALVGAFTDGIWRVS